MPKRLVTRTFRGTPRNLARLARALQQGALVAVPTETVYGLAGDGLSPAACARIFAAKGRPTNDPLILHIHSYRQWEEIAEINEAARRVASAFWPGPLTLVLPKKEIVPALATSGLPSVAVRMPQHPLFRRLLRACGRPLAAPSANPFGYISPTSAAHVKASLSGKIGYILDGGEAAIGLESTILDLRDPAHPAILRPGAISARDLGRVLGRRVHTPHSPQIRPSVAAPAPGMLTKHYSPRTRLTLHRRLSPSFLQALPVDEAALCLRQPRFARRGPQPRNVHWLSPDGDLAQAAHHLFGALRTLDQGGWKHLHAEVAPGRSALALALNDRLSRAAAKG